jgi:hypothetical protein
MSKLTDIKAFRDALRPYEQHRFGQSDRYLDSTYGSAWEFAGREVRDINLRVSWCETMIKSQLRMAEPPKPPAMRPEDV